MGNGQRTNGRDGRRRAGRWGWAPGGVGDPRLSGVVRRGRAAVLAALYVLAWTFVGIGTLSAALPAPASAQSRQITDCSGEGTSTTPGTVAYAVYGGGTWNFACSGTLPITTTMSVAGGTTVALLGGGQSVRLDGGSSTQIFSVASGAALTLDGLTLQNSAGPDGGSGGGAIVSAGALTVISTTFQNNQSGIGGGGAIENNYGTVNVSNSTFSDNSSTIGGAIASSGGTLSISDSTFTGNTAIEDAGAVYQGDGTITVSGSTFSDNLAGSFGDGGALYANGAAASVSDSTFSRNEASFGGAVAVDDAGSLQLSGSTFVDNSSPFGGAIADISVTSVSNSTFTGNTAPHGQGGAIWLYQGSDTLTVVNSTLAGNSADPGQGGNLYGSGTLINTVVANSLSGGNCSGGIVSGSNDLEYGDSTCGSSPIWRTGDPHLESLANNGGPTETMALGAGSAAIAAGDAADCAAAPVGGLDQRGLVRPAGNCDIGAYQTEIQSLGVSAAPMGIAAGGSATVTAVVYDQTGAALPDQVMTFSVPSGSGSVGSVTAGGDGTYSATFTAPATAPVSDPVTVTASVYSEVYGRLTATVPVTIWPVPAVTAVIPASGPLAGGTTVDITGSGFAVAGQSVVDAVYFGASQAALLNVASTDHLTATAPPGSGTVDVTVATAGGSSAASAVDAFTYLPAPTVTGVSPTSGLAEGGTVVAITGANFQSPATVAFGGAPATDVAVQSSTQIEATAPPGSGTVDVTVTTPGGASSSTAADQFTYITPAGPPATATLALAPATVAAGATTTVSGAVYDAGGHAVSGTMVDLLLAGNVIATTETGGDGGYSATLASPATAGTYTVTAEVAGNALATGTLTVINPGITITGADTEPRTARVSGTTAEAGGGTGAVTVQSYSGNPGPVPSFTSDGKYFDVSLAAGSTFASVTITQCSASAGDQLYWLDGRGWAAVSPGAQFDPGTGCLTFTAETTGTLPAIADLTGTPFAVAAPPAEAGGGGALSFAAPAPVIARITPASGPAAGGTPVTISGSGFDGATAVSFGTSPAATYSVNSDTQIVAVSPAGAAGTTVDLTVTTLDGTSATGLADRFSYAAPVAQTVPAATTFSDVPTTYWAYAAISALAVRGVVSGFPNGAFEPDAAVTRAQFAKMLDLTLGLRVAGAGTTFQDVPASAWYAPYVAAAAQAGLLDGISASKFDPDGVLTREEMAVLLERALKLDGQTKLSFQDAGQVDDWARVGVEAAVAAGYIQGLPNDTLQPLGPTTRAQAAKVLALVLQDRPPGGSATSGS
jgi:hypothetical protein